MKKILFILLIISQTIHATEYSRGYVESYCTLSGTVQSASSPVQNLPVILKYGNKLKFLSSTNNDFIFTEYSNTEEIITNNEDEYNWTNNLTIPVSQMKNNVSFPMTLPDKNNLNHEINLITLSQNYRPSKSIVHRMIIPGSINLTDKENENEIKKIYRNILINLGAKEVPDFNLSSNIRQENFPAKALYSEFDTPVFNGFNLPGTMEYIDFSYKESPSQIKVVQLHYPLTELDGLSYHMTWSCNNRSYLYLPPSNGASFIYLNPELTNKLFAQLGEFNYNNIQCELGSGCYTTQDINPSSKQIYINVPNIDLIKFLKLKHVNHIYKIKQLKCEGTRVSGIRCEAIK